MQTNDLCIITSSFNGGGAEKIAVSLANYYSSQGIIVTLVAFNAKGPYSSQIDASVRVVDLKAKRTRYVFFSLLSTLKHIRPSAVLSVVRDANIMVGFTRVFFKSYFLVFREANTMHDWSGGGLISKILNRTIMKYCYSKANMVIANSLDTKNDLIKSNIVPRSGVTVIRNPVLPANVDSLMNQAPDHPWLLGSEYTTILNVGRLHFQKNQKMLIEAFSVALKLNQKLRLIILGEGEEKKSLIKQLEFLDIRHYVDIIDFDLNPYRFYKNSDLFVLTSRWEGFGNVLVEAMACGTPIISVDCPGAPRDTLGNGKFGKLVPMDSVEILAKEINNLVNVTQSPGFTQAQIQRANYFSIDIVAKEYLGIIFPRFN